jgi:2-keto-4-pentenoate hydratase/2-oxohepta-3-ene-1,7-dioic acid hydratase in catechol pathway
VNYDDLLLELRLNGETKQKERTSHMIQDVPSIVSFISDHVTLHPGDLIYTGTSGTTTPIKAGDVVEVELEGAGVLRNPVVAE